MKSDADWRKELAPATYRVMREKGTELPFSGSYYQNQQSGTYHCAACDNPLFSSNTKYESGTGWPSFYQAIAEGSMETTVDESHGMVRIEVHCAKCGGHLGHLFSDGPQPTGQRYCMNSVALKFEPDQGKE